MKVWVSTLRRGIQWHVIGKDGKTVCGRFIGPHGAAGRGHVIGRIEAVDLYAAHQCTRCAGAK